MTYIELVVVLSIFSIISGITIFNYKQFQARVDLKNLATQIAQKILEAQKNAVSGKLYFEPNGGQQPPVNWKPSYGVYFNLQSGPNTGDKVFYFYADYLPRDGNFNDAPPSGSYVCDDECIEKITITKGSYISDVVDSGGISLKNTPNVQNLHINFTRPSSSASFSAIPSGGMWTNTYIDIILASPNTSSTVTVRVWPSGRIEVR